MEIALILAYIAFAIFLITKLKFFNTEGLSRQTLIMFFLLKVVAGFALWAVYTYYYTNRSTADIYKYFDDSKVIFDAIRHHPTDYIRMLLGLDFDKKYFEQHYYTHTHFWHTTYWENQTIIRFNAFLRLFSLGSYHVHSIIVCFISFMGLVLLYKTFYPYFQQKKRLLYFALFLFPSVVFWSSGVLKEGFIFFGLGLLLYHVRQSLEIGLTQRRIYYMLLAIAVLVFTKAYVLIALVPGLLAYIIVYTSGKIRTVIKHLIVLVICAASFLFADKFQHKFNPTESLYVKQKDFINLGMGGLWIQRDTTYYLYIPQSNRDYLKPFQTKPYTDTDYVSLKAHLSYYYFKIPKLLDTLYVNDNADTITQYQVVYDVPVSGSYFKIPRLDQHSKWSFIKNTPTALWNVFTRPYPQDALNPFLMLAVLENLFVVFLLILVVFFGIFKWADRNILLMFISYTMILFTLTGWVTPVAGAIMRYKVPAMPFLLMALFMMIDVEKLKEKFSILRKL